MVDTIFKHPNNICNPDNAAAFIEDAVKYHKDPELQINEWATRCVALAGNMKNNPEEQQLTLQAAKMYSDYLAIMENKA